MRVFQTNERGEIRLRLRALATAVLLVGSLLSSGGPAAAEEWTPIGPEGASPLSLAIDPTTPNTLYVGAQLGGVFKSEDAGATWTAYNVGLTFPNVPALAVDPVTPTTLYAATEGGVFKSEDGGVSWSARNTGLTQLRIFALALDPSNPADLYAGTFEGVFKSEDGGATWEPRNNGLTNLIIRAFAVNPISAGTVYAATDGGVFKSENAGASWAPRNAGLPNARTFVLAIDPVTPTTLYVGARGLGADLFKSVDGGETWAPTGLGSFYIVNALAIDPLAPNTLYAATQSGVFKSEDGAATWTPRNTGLTEPGVRLVAVDPITPGTVYAGISSLFGIGGIFKSEDGAATWTLRNTGLTNLPVFALAVDPWISNTVYAGSIDVFKTDDAGATWTGSTAGWSRQWGIALVVDPSSPSTLYAATKGGGIFKSEDGGATWAARNNGLGYLGLASLAIDPWNSDTLYAGTAGLGVYKSQDAGDSWVERNTGITGVRPSLVINALVIDPENPNTVYAGEMGAGVFKSVDGGDNWEAINTGLTQRNVQALAIDPITPTTLYAAAWGGAFKSVNGGDSWAMINVGLTTSLLEALVIDPVTPTTLYTGGGSFLGGGVFKSTDGGDNWVPLNAGLTSFLVQALAVDPQNPSTVYAGTRSSVFKLTSGGNPPVAFDQTVTTPEDTSVSFNATGSDPDGDPLTFIQDTNASFGSTLFFADGSVTYIPNADFYGQDSFSFLLNDGTSDSNVATITIDVTPVNDAPVAIDDLPTTDEDVMLTINVLGNDLDVDGDPLLVFFVDAVSAQGGTITNHGASVTYTPPLDFSGTDSFTYQATDGSLVSGLATVTVTVVNNPDDDGDGILDEVDLEPNNPSFAFSDAGLGGTSSGTILSVGNQIVTVSEETNPLGVRIRTDLSGGPTPAQFSVCGGIATFPLGPGVDLVVTCSSVSLAVQTGSFTADFVGADGCVATAFLRAGDELKFTPESCRFTNDGENPVVLDFEGDLVSLGAGETLRGVVVDIKPGSDANSINPKSKGVIPVAILTTDDFDATTVSAPSLLFGPAGASEAHGRGHVEDVNGDDLDDMMLHFRTQEVGISEGTTGLCLTGTTTDGTRLRGCDSIAVSGGGK